MVAKLSLVSGIFPSLLSADMTACAISLGVNTGCVGVFFKSSGSVTPAPLVAARGVLFPCTRSVFFPVFLGEIGPSFIDSLNRPLASVFGFFVD